MRTNANKPSQTVNAAHPDATVPDVVVKAADLQPPAKLPHEPPQAQLTGSVPAIALVNLNLTPPAQPKNILELTALATQTVPLRRQLVLDHLAKRPANPDILRWLGAAVEALETLAPKGKASLEIAPGIGGKPLDIEVGVVTAGLRQDVAFFSPNGGDKALYVELEKVCPNLREEVEAAHAYLGDISGTSIVTDRDGTISPNYFNYAMSVQPGWTAVLLLRNEPERLVQLTSGPIDEGGLKDVSTFPEGSAQHVSPLVYAGSKGAAGTLGDGVRYSRPIPEEQQRVLSEFNARVDQLCQDKPEYRMFAVGLLGSGIQHKHGQTTIAVNTPENSVGELSQAFVNDLRALVKHLDPEGKVFEAEKVDQTGTITDFDVTLKLGEAAYEKSDGLEYTAAQMKWNFREGKIALLGDGSGDLYFMKRAAQNPAAKFIYVTPSEGPKQKVRDAVPNPHFVSHPYVLVCTVGYRPPVQEVRWDAAPR